ncbi:hypothetical protein [Mucilaginibacter sp.]|uniref:hypothetical protein n=1 Tax=Mucilaginibacter sp. TaxID=1882438 RepID=UPI0032642B85
MIEPIVDIAVSENPETWGKNITLKRGLKASVYYRVTVNDASLIKFIIPVCEDNATTETALMNRTTWDKLEFMVTDKDDEGKCLFTKDGNPGIFALNFESYLPPSQEVTLCIQFAPVDTKARISCGYEYRVDTTYNKPDPQFKIQLPLDPKQATIESFTTDYAALLLSEKYALTWSVKNAEKLFIKVGDQKEEEVEIVQTKPYELQPNAGPRVVKLSAQSEYIDEKTPIVRVEKQINIIGAQSSIIIPVEGAIAKSSPFGDNLLVNLVKTDENTMYALVTDAAKTNIWLWKTNDGVNWENTGIASDGSIPAKAACSSGIFYKNRIYLIGGSRFDSNEQSDTTYYYEFGPTPTSGTWGKINVSTFSPRMGQAVVIVKSDAASAGQIYLLGGYGQDGPLADIHTFNGDNNGWAPFGSIMDASLCMHTAYFANGELQVYGGSSYGPNHPERKMASARSINVLDDIKSWKGLGWTIQANVPQLAFNIVSCALAKCKNELFFFGIYQVGENFEEVISRIDASAPPVMKKMPGNAGFKTEYCGSLQAVEFKNAIWITYVSDNDTLYSAGLNCYLSIPATVTTPQS